mmetsp:Transcript_14674/g.34848  ORF Transcript_14674/g.34848 Transcript_14674/m.34848 type:complete len:99 (-) Transcript_14674:1006-1302(-)
MAEYGSDSPVAESETLASKTRMMIVREKVFNSLCVAIFLLVPLAVHKELYDATLFWVLLAVAATKLLMMICTLCRPGVLSGSREMGKRSRGELLGFTV